MTAAYPYDGGRDAHADAGRGEAGGLRALGGTPSDGPVPEIAEDLLRDVPGRVGATRGEASEVADSDTSQRYRTIVADPPWPYREGAFKRMAATGRSANIKRDGVRAVQGRALKRSLPYTGMSVDAICELPVHAAAHPDGSRLFLWTTNRFLRAAFSVVEAWGFQYVQTLVWHKLNPVPFPIDVAPSSAEFLLTGTVGTPGQISTWDSSVVALGVPKEHSRKPEAFLDLVEQVSRGPYLELFARRNRLGWDTWGNEALPHVELSA